METWEESLRSVHCFTSLSQFQTEISIYIRSSDTITLALPSPPITVQTNFWGLNPGTCSIAPRLPLELLESYLISP